MRRRCFNPRRANFRYYGGRGIIVCDGWGSFESFYRVMGDPPDGCTLDRKNNESGYYCGECKQCQDCGRSLNCQWATRIEQVRNTRRNHKITINESTRTISEWASFLGIKPYLIHNRLRYGWHERDAVLVPVFGKRSA